MPLTILSIAYPLAPVGPDAVGGAEQVLTQLDQAIVEAGHTSIIVAMEGSTTRGQLVPIPREAGPLDDSARARSHTNTLRAIDSVLASRSVDLIHMHGLHFERYLPASGGSPVLATLHLPPHLYAGSIWSLARPLTFVHGVSRTQHALLPEATVPILEPIPNGVPLDALRPADDKQKFVLALGRMCSEKGFHLAADAARRAGHPFVLAGAVFPYDAHEQYFQRALQPLIDDGGIDYMGPVGLREKRSLLARARCLLVPSQTPETSSLVAMEALACGTPVVAFRAGALAEIVEDGRTGFLVDNVSEMADAIGRLDVLDPIECRHVAEERFSSSTMTARYLERYQCIASASTKFSRPLLVQEISSISGLESVRDDWADLWQRTEAPSVFQHPDWLIPWCRPFGVGEPWVLMVRRRERLIGVAPFVVYRRERERVLTLLGAGVSDDQGIIIERGSESSVLEAVAAHFMRHNRAFDVCELENLSNNSPLLRISTGWQTVWQRQWDVRPVLHIPTGVARLDDVLPAKMVSELRYREHRAQRAHLQPAFDTATPDSFDELFEALVRLHRARWTARGETGAMPQHLVDFHREAGRRLLARGLLRLHGLRLGGQLAAVFYGYHAAGRTVYYLSGFDPSLERFSPGNLVVARAIQYAISRDRARAFDFLRGAESYKYAWGAKNEPLIGVGIRVAAHAA